VPSPAGPCRRLLEEERWNALVARHSPRLRASIRGALRRAGIEPQCEDVEEIAQESYCRLLACGRLEPERGGELGLSGFLARVGERLAFDSVRRDRAAKRGSGLLRGLADIGPDRLAACCVDRSPSPERTLLALEHWRETVLRWREIVGGRTPGRDVVIVSLGLAGWSSEQISVACSRRLQPNTIDTIVGRTRLRLAEAGIALPARFRGVRGERAVQLAARAGAGPGGAGAETAPL
jgi:DNA-directed RNA polymerase specialized sigma24 family protein